MPKFIRPILIILAFIIFTKIIGKILPFLIILGVIALVLWKAKKLPAEPEQLLTRIRNAFSGKPKAVATMINPNSFKTPSAAQARGAAKIIITVAAIFIVLALTVTVVPAGHVGVMDFFGRVSSRELSPGLNLKIPLSRVIKFSTQTQDYTMTTARDEGQVKGDDSIAALTKEGLKVTLDITVLYHLEKNQAAQLYKNIGQNYESKIIRPAIRSSIREVVAQYTAEALYSEKRAESAANLLALLKKKIDPRGILVEDVMLRDVTLPAGLSSSIEEKLKADQEAQRFDFVLQKEQKEAERKRIEAAGQRDAQKIVTESLTDKYLQYLYIRELKDRAGTIYVPTNPTNGLPMFKGL